jgi:hypothetical protein
MPTDIPSTLTLALLLTAAGATAGAALVTASRSAQNQATSVPAPLSPAARVEPTSNQAVNRGPGRVIPGILSRLAYLAGDPHRVNHRPKAWRQT